MKRKGTLGFVGRLYTPDARLNMGSGRCKPLTAKAVSFGIGEAWAKFEYLGAWKLDPNK